MTSGAEPEDIEEAAAFLAWVASPSHQVVGETDDFIGILERIVNRPSVVGGVVNDARLAAACIAQRERKARRTLGLVFPEERRYVVRSGSEWVNGQAEG